MGSNVFWLRERRLRRVDTRSRVVFSLGERRNNFVYKETISYSLETSYQHLFRQRTQTRPLLIQVVADLGGLEAELPHDQEHMVEQLEAHPTT